ncbi:MAG: hypothetical protein IJO61_09085 [Oscillospiraceae bacterium]|nr:hypothetical protein [Oscillospiraceae bacterium]MBQ6847270.1 hypothetical protein [Oscillospiraceae bacterium]
MGYVKGFVGAVATVTMIMAIVAVVTPKNAAGRAAMLCGSILLMTVLVSPMKELDPALFSEYDRKIESEIETKAEMMRQKSERLKESIIEENLRTYIFKRAEQFGIRCDAQPEYFNGEVCSVTVKLENEKDVEKVSQILVEECGIAKENQTFEVSE